MSVSGSFHVGCFGTGGCGSHLAALLDDEVAAAVLLRPRAADGTTLKNGLSLQDVPELLDTFVLDDSHTESMGDATNCCKVTVNANAIGLRGDLRDICTSVWWGLCKETSVWWGLCKETSVWWGLCKETSETWRRQHSSIRERRKEDC
ncbi:unnamed protein product [Hyaloperonospora brassicae]|uniref:Uncharacterized protein n=1 Tax=Hyaloperonospora brassicae TaxID=162125 RepID=A0AAV0UCG1_HYABA|nr:unnamed protein product [Hyaloperonospora brassicae]